MELHRSLREAGLLKNVRALRSVESATSVRVRAGDAEIVDGPFAVTKEVLGGYYLVDCADLDEALELAARVPAAGWGTIEVRPVVPADEFVDTRAPGRRRGVRRRRGRDGVSDAAITRAFREERAMILATLIRQVGDFQLAEDAVQDAFEAAVGQWERDGVPANPGRLADHRRAAAGDRSAAPQPIGGRSRGAPGRAATPRHPVRGTVDG